MPHSEALFEKSCLRCHPTHSYHRMRSSGVEQLFNPPGDIPQGPHPCVHMPACSPHFLRSSAWNQRVRETPCSDVARRCDGRKTSMPWRNVCFSKRASLYCSCLMCFFTAFFFTPFAFFVFIPPASRIEFIFGRRPTYSAIARPAHSNDCSPGALVFKLS